MILDRLDNAATYAPLHSLFGRAMDFLRAADGAALAAGRHEIAGSEVFALVSDAQGRGPENSPLEAHRRFIDLQYTVSGCEVIGWRARRDCVAPSQPYREDADIEFFADRPDTFLAVPPGHVAIFWPHDAHAPLAGRQAVRKIVVKVAVAPRGDGSATMAP